MNMSLPLSREFVSSGVPAGFFLTLNWMILYNEGAEKYMADTDFLIACEAASIGFAILIKVGTLHIEEKLSNCKIVIQETLKSLGQTAASTIPLSIIMYTYLNSLPTIQLGIYGSIASILGWVLMYGIIHCLEKCFNNDLPSLVQTPLLINHNVISSEPSESHLPTTSISQPEFSR